MWWCWGFVNFSESGIEDGLGYGLRGRLGGFFFLQTTGSRFGGYARRGVVGDGCMR